ncbi:MAG: RagB/SusD family nutrient uptake outer membrane protein [Rikenellaceae bacterium]|nr:RagB/SusD family nutrient uptake outer membrane protein [Rikenellaceae bacterium]
MRKYINTILTAALILGATSCSNWFDVSPENLVTKDDLFSTNEGFRIALNGIYIDMSQKALYGQELTWSFTSFLGQNYDLSPYSWNTLSPYIPATKYDYENSYLKGITDAIWTKGFNAIANCNLLIQEIETHDGSFFMEGEREKKLLLAEAKGLRALMHFDILRLFAPAPIVNDNNAYIPYVKAYPTIQPQRLKTTEVMQNIIEDLSYAKTNLAENDTLYNASMMSDPNYRFTPGYSGNAKGGAFFGFRGTRFNYFAASALLARAYLYLGDKENAYKNALDVYRFHSVKTWFKFTASSNIIIEDKNVRHTRLYDDILLAFNNTNVYTLYTNWNTNNYFFSPLSIKNLSNLFGGDTDDFRLTKLIYSNYSLKWEPKTLDSWYNGSIIEEEDRLLPVIRLSEVYYIMCEYLADNNIAKGIQLLQELRTARGAKVALSTTLPKDKFLEAVYNDATREFIAEGQTFYLYKRLNRPMYNGATPIDMTGKYFITLPDSERAYY